MAYQCTECDVHIIGSPHFENSKINVKACEPCYQEYYKIYLECTCSSPTDDPSDFCLANPDKCWYASIEPETSVSQK